MRSLLLTLAIPLICLATMTPTPTHAEKKAFVGTCTGTDTGHRNARRACRSGQFSGQDIVTCRIKRNGTRKVLDRRTCNSDGERFGIYINSCSGAEINFNTLKSACQSGNHEGAALVRCRNGREKKHMTCAAAADSDANVELFVEQCGSDTKVDGRNLRRACRRNAGLLLTKCRKRGGIWKEVKAMQCDGNRDRVKFKRCTPGERAILLSDYRLAEQRVDTVITDLEAALQAGQIPSDLRRKMRVVRRKLGKMQTAFDRKRTFVCKHNSRRCSGANAHTMYFGHKVRYCDNYFQMTGSPQALGLPAGTGLTTAQQQQANQLARVGTLVHEVSHYKTETYDRANKYNRCGRDVPRASHKFHNNAEYYEYITECGFVIPQ